MDEQEAIPGFPTYSREEFLTAYNDFLAFATKMYLDPSTYEWPPSTGWPEMTIDSMRHFGKTPAVVDLLRNLPYPKHLMHDSRPQIMPNMVFAAWHIDSPGWSQSKDNAEGYCAMTEGHDEYEHVPASVVGLAYRPKIDHGVLLDTKLGVVYWIEAANEFQEWSPFPALGMDLEMVTEYNPDSWNDEGDMTEGERNWAAEARRGMSEGEREWRHCETVWSIPDFFATLKYMFTELKFVPMTRRRIVDGWYPLDTDGQDAVEMVKGIYREHGWPDLERYRKEDCQRAIHAALKENYPDELDEDSDDDEEDGG